MLMPVLPTWRNQSEEIDGRLLLALETTTEGFLRWNGLLPAVPPRSPSNNGLPIPLGDAAAHRAPWPETRFPVGISTVSRALEAKQG
jgi:hypothetical protein